MTETHRVIVTGKDQSGKSQVLEDLQVGVSGPGNFNFWQSLQGVSPLDSSAAKSPTNFFPGASGTMFRLFSIPAANPEMTPQDLEKLQEWFFNEVGFAGARVDTTRHPLMHTTPTLDYVILLSGEISLLLDRGEPVPLKPFDAVVQRATNHFWVNTGTTPALLMSVMVGGA
jgi:hypothetical protein